MSESRDKIWQLRKSFLEAEAQDDTAAALLKTDDQTPMLNGDSVEAPVTETEINAPTIVVETEPIDKESIAQSNMDSPQNDIHKSMETMPSTLETGIKSTESKSTPDLGQDLEVPGGNEKTSLSQPLLNGIHKNGGTKENIQVATSQTSLRSQNDRKEGSVLSFHNIDYKVKVPGEKSRCGCGKKDDKFILKDISGVCRPGMNAILGPTGSGKTSLLDILAGRKDPRGLSGQVLVDGAAQPGNFKCMAGYVIQDDVVVGMLTVKENIKFSAALRLPQSVSEDQRTERVEEIIQELGLSKCADTKIGTPMRRGVSGGERKRTNIAMEMITRPSVLFLDEPTTGLDATTAYNVMYQLKKLSQRGTTVIFSIHQPRYSIYKLFDNLFLLDEGRLLYQGPASQALSYFNTIGYTCEEHNNPSDFFLDILGNMVMPSSQPGDTTLEIKKKENGTVIEMELEEAEDQGKIRHDQLVQAFHNSKWHQNVEDQLHPIKDALTAKTVGKATSISYATSCCKQLAIVGGRTFRNMIRNFHTLATQVISAIILSILVGSIYYQVDESFTSGLQNRVGAFFFIVMNFVFGNMAAMEVFLKDRTVFVHENISGYYRVSVYFLSKLLCDVLPQRILPGLVFASISYWMIGLSPDVLQFLFFSLNICLTSLTGTTVALLFSATVNNGSVGSLLTALVWTTMMVFSGLLVNIESVPGWLRWLKCLSIFRYSMNAFTINELKDMTFCDSLTNSTQTHCDTGNEYMERQGISYESAWDLWFNELMLAVIGISFLILTYIQLRRVKKLN